MAASASGTESGTAKKKVFINMGKFKEYNKKFNGKKMAADRMSFRSFKHLTIDIKCLKNINRADLCCTFDHYSNMSKKGTRYMYRYIEFPQLMRCLDELVKIEAQRTTKTSTADADAATALEKKVFEEIKELNPNNVRQRIKSFFATILAAHDSIKDVSTVTAGTLTGSTPVIARSIAEDLDAVGTTVKWVGPATGLIKSICERIVTSEKIQEEAGAFTATLAYPTDTIEFIGTHEPYQTDMMARRLKRLEDILTRAQTILSTIDRKRKSSTGKKDEGKLDGISDELNEWMEKTVFLQLADENQKMQAELKESRQIMRQVLTENRERWKEISERLADLFLKVEDDNNDVTAAGEDTDRSIRVIYDPSLPPDYLRPSDLLIYHDYRDKDLALDIQRKLTEKMKPLRLPDGREERVKVRILNEYQSEGVPQIQLEKALNLASVKLILVTRNLTKLKGLEYHHLEILSILRESKSGEVFALRCDEDYKDYIKQLDFYVQGLLEGCFYEPPREDFVDEMFEVFKRNITSRIEREKQLDDEEEEARRRQTRLEEMEKMKEAKATAEQDKECERIQHEMQKPDITEEDLDKLQKEWDEVMKKTH